MSRRKEYTLSVDTAAEQANPIWRNLEEKAAPEEFRARAAEEFPDSGKEISEIQQEVSGLIDSQSLVTGRRGFMSATGAAAAAMGLSACIRRPEENILPYTHAPEYLIPGVPLNFATAISKRGDAVGLLVESHEGRPTKIEGNPEHPSNAGTADLQAQASVMDLYDPDRSQSPVHAGKDSTFAEFDKAAASLVTGTGAGVSVLLQPGNSPTRSRVLAAFTTKYPDAKVHYWEPLTDSSARTGLASVFGGDDVIRALNDYSSAKVILSLGSDFLSTEPGGLRAARQYAASRRVRSVEDAEQMNRVYVVEPGYSVTGTNADHRLRLNARDILGYTLALAAKLGVEGAGAHSAPAGVPAMWIDEVASDLTARAGQSVVVAGSGQPAAVHALVARINHKLGNIGKTVRYVAAPFAGTTDVLASLRDLVADLNAGKTKTLLVLGGNPVYDAPADLAFGDALAKAETSVHLSSHRDETSAKCNWHVPRAHELETWGDQLAFDGAYSIQQPLIAPIWGGRSDAEVLGHLAGIANWRGHYLVRETTVGAVDGPFKMSESQWRASLQKGVATTEIPSLVEKTELVAGTVGAPGESAAPLGPNNVEVVFVACNKMLDGRHANNVWLQELPDSLTRMSWDNAALVSPNLLKHFGVRKGAKVKLGSGSKSVVAPVWPVPGLADWSVILPLGWGRTKAGRYAEGSGTDFYPLRDSDALGFTDGITLAPVGEVAQLSQTQEDYLSVVEMHDIMEKRPITLDATVEEYRQNPEFTQYKSIESSVPPLWKEVEYNGHKWGLNIDLNACIGCSACVVACQSENNLPWVGREQVAKGREMFWLRMDRYFMGTDEDAPKVAFQPMMCQQCEEAPCENVCPVNATAHSPEGLNDMAYNRCIGTRYCANNCPYKARRFNYLNWNRELPQTAQLQKNPDVTVRFRGVMEKCTYCVQRIQEHKIIARREDRRINDGEIKTACQQTCPTGAIVFGDLNDPKAEVTKLAALDRRYKVLVEIGTQPRTTYLGKLRNPNPRFGGTPKAADEAHNSGGHQ